MASSSPSKLSNTHGDSVNGSSNRFSWEEVHEHNKRDDCWMVIKGKVYDVTSWVEKHPGGDLIMTGAGRDATPFFISYHPTKVFPILSKYEIGSVKEYKPFYQWDSEFYSVMKRRVEEFDPANRNPWAMYIRTVVVFSLWAYFYYVAMIQGYFIGALLFGFFHAQIGLSTAHEGGHGSFSKNKHINFLAGAVIDFMGASWLIWSMQHNVGHHPNTNRQGQYEDEDFDPDVKSGYPLLRLSPVTEWKPHHKYQHLYIWILIPFAGIKWMYGDLKYFIRGNFQSMRFWGFSKWNLRMQFVTKSFFLFYSFFVPVYLHGLLHALPLTCALFAVNSYVFSLLFIVNHLTEKTIFPALESQRDWAKLQAETTSNYAINSTAALWMSSGLNLQIEHHLFPYICYLNLKKISPIVQQTCKEYGVEYNSYDTYTEAIISYYQHLKKMGNPPGQGSKVKSN